jgi:hypothetical protein
MTIFGLGLEVGLADGAALLDEAPGRLVQRLLGGVPARLVSDGRLDPRFGEDPGKHERQQPGQRPGEEPMADKPDDTWPPPHVAYVAPARPADRAWAPPAAEDALRGTPAGLGDDGVVAVLDLHRLEAVEEAVRAAPDGAVVTVVVVTGDPEPARWPAWPSPACATACAWPCRRRAATAGSARPS